MDAIAKVDGPTPDPKPKPAPAATTPPKPAATKPPEPKPKPGAEPRQPAPELRKQYETLKTEHEALKGKIPELEAKIADWEKRGKDTEGLQAKLAGLEKERAKLKADLFVYNQTSDEAFIRDYEVPFDQAAEYARQEVTGLQYTDDDQTTRPATWQDFARIYKMEPGQALAEIEARFGSSALIPIEHYRQLRRLTQMKQAAAEDLRKNAEARMKEHETQQALMSEQRRTMLTRVGKELGEKVAEYHDDPADAESMAARNKGYEVFDAEAKTPKEQILKDSHVRHRFAAYNPLRLKVMRLEKELADLKAGAAQAGDPDGDPGADTRRGGGGGSTGVDNRTWEEHAREELKP